MQRHKDRIFTDRQGFNRVVYLVDLNERLTVGDRAIFSSRLDNLANSEVLNAKV